MGRIISPDAFRESIGTEIGVSDWILVDQERIDSFAHATLDAQFIHVDPLRAAETPFGGTIAHGFLSLSLLSPMAYSGVPSLEGMKMGLNYGFNNVRFLTPVASGRRIRGHFVLKSFSERAPGRWQTILDVSVEIEGEDQPALVAEWITLHLV